MDFAKAKDIIESKIKERLNFENSNEFQNFIEFNKND